MKTVGVIAEYNPFHSGHAYHIQQGKALSGADWCVAVMSGDFVQRGEPAIYSKYLRTKMALEGGADLVVEMPSAFASSSAEDFAACGVALLSALGAVEFICFGSEDGNLKGIQDTASLLAKESDAFKMHLREGMRGGLSWPQARNQALLVMSGPDKGFPVSRTQLNKLLGSPNNLLGIEYCKAIIRQKSHLVPLTVRRLGMGYHDRALEHGQASASALRQLLLSAVPGNTETGRKNACPPSLLSHVPPNLLPLYMEERPLSVNDMSGLLNYRLLSMHRKGEDFSLYADVSQELSSRLENHLLQYDTWEGRISQLKTKQYTYTRVSRALLHLVLGITASQINEYKAAGWAGYARILGFRRDASELLSLIRKQSAIPLITKTADASRILTGTALDMFEQDLLCSHIRQSVVSEKYGLHVKNEYNQPVCII